MLSPSFSPSSSPSRNHLLPLRTGSRKQQGGEGCPAAGSVNTAARAAMGAGGGREWVSKMQPCSRRGAEHGLRLQRRKVFKHPQCLGNGTCCHASSSPSLQPGHQNELVSHLPDGWKCWGGQQALLWPQKHPCLPGPCPLQCSPGLSSFQAG